MPHFLTTDIVNLICRTAIKQIYTISIIMENFMISSSNFVEVNIPVYKTLDAIINGCGRLVVKLLN
jgi:hypothetical protein